MSTTLRNQMKEVMQMAWSFVRKNGYSMSEALKCAWANLKLKVALKVKVVEKLKVQRKRLIIAKCTLIQR